jgi:hypothetical protein
MIQNLSWLLCLGLILPLSLSGQVDQKDVSGVGMISDSLVMGQRKNPFVPQKYLVLDKPGRVKRLRFPVGSQLTFQIKEDRTIYTDEITAVDDSSFTISDIRVRIGDVDRIIVRRKNGFVGQVSKKLIQAGVLYFLLDNFNPIFLGRRELSVSQGSLIVGAAFVGPGLLLKLFQRKTYRIGERRRLHVLEN